MGVGTTENTDKVTEVTELSGKHILSIAPGMHHTIALSNDGHGNLKLLLLLIITIALKNIFFLTFVTVYSFGRGSYGQLGTGAIDSNKPYESKPVQIATFNALENGGTF